MGRDDSWLATVPSLIVFSFSEPTAHFSLNGQSANLETPKIVELYFRSQIWWQIPNQETRIPIRIF